MPRWPQDQRERFWSKVDKTGDCWTWRGRTNSKGHGQIFIDGQERQAHRVAYRWIVGEPDEVVHHECGNPSCVNPDHLSTMSHEQHTRLHNREGHNEFWRNARKTHCKHGHRFTKENTYIRPSGRRDCRKCIARRQREYKRRQEAGGG